MAEQPKPVRIAILGDYPGEQDLILGKVFLGQSGQELTRMLADAGINRYECYLTTVFKTRPPKGDFYNWCVPKSGIEKKSKEQPIFTGKYLNPALRPQVDACIAELEAVAPTIIIALGAIPNWVLTGSGKISKLRGVVAHSHRTHIKVIGTYAPATVLRQWEFRPIVVADLMKAKRESLFPEVIRPEREVWVEPTVEDLITFERDFIQQAKVLSFDIETGNKMIKCVGIAVDKTTALVVPFLDKRKPGWSYWATPQEEILAWGWLRKILMSNKEKLAQNGLYDVQYLLRTSHNPVNNFCHDTMLLHHTLQPEMEKDLGFLGSIYTNEASWKIMRPRGSDEIKKDD